MNIYEQYGRLQEQYANEIEAHQKTVGVLRALKNGDLLLESLTVGTEDNTWRIDPPSPVTLSIVEEEAKAN